MGAFNQKEFEAGAVVEIKDGSRIAHVKPLLGFFEIRVRNSISFEQAQENWSMPGLSCVACGDSSKWESLRFDGRCRVCVEDNIFPKEEKIEEIMTSVWEGVEEGGEWILHDGGECPIPWAKAGEYEVRFPANNNYATLGFFAPLCDAKDSYDWNKYAAYRLTDRWIPVIGGKCPEVAIGWEAYQREGKDSSGNIKTMLVGIPNGGTFSETVAVRPIKQTSMSEIMDKALTESVQIIHKGKLASIKEHRAADEQDYFEQLMSSYESKRKALREAKLHKSVVPPIGVAAMMVIAGKFIND